MTAELVVLNSEAVALAADSAVTADWGDGNSKVLYSQNKIFELTESSQVAVMIYGRHHFMSLPLDIIIADYKRKNGHVTYPKLDDYVAAFTQHMVQVVNTQVNAEEQRAHQLDRIGAIFNSIRQSVNMTVHSYWEEQRQKGGILSPDEFEELGRRITVDEINNYFETFRETELLEGFTEESIARGRSDIQIPLQELRDELFGDDLTRDAQEKLDEIAYRSNGVMIGDLFQGRLPSVSGIVFVGFGEEELLPSYFEVHVEGIYRQNLRVRQAGEGHISREEQSIIQPFAQTDMVELFVEGVLPGYNAVVADVVHTEFEKLCVELAENGELPEETRNQLRDELENLSSEFIGKVMTELYGRRAMHVAELHQAVEGLSKTELADIAEALINLTSLDRQIQFYDESVGGPTDVAVITKGDGLVWIKRKQYFEPGLNPEYRARLRERE